MIYNYNLIYKQIARRESHIILNFETNLMKINV